MNWTEAVAAMREGHVVRRKSEIWVKTIDAGQPELQGDHWRDGVEHAPIFESGQEGMRLMHAWTPDETAVLVFMGADSKCLCVPDDEHRSATDWIIVNPTATSQENQHG